MATAEEVEEEEEELVTVLFLSLLDALLDSKAMSNIKQMTRTRVYLRSMPYKREQWRHETWGITTSRILHSLTPGTTKEGDDMCDTSSS